MLISYKFQKERGNKATKKRVSSVPSQGT